MPATGAVAAVAGGREWRRWGGHGAFWVWASSPGSESRRGERNSCRAPRIAPRRPLGARRPVQSNDLRTGPWAYTPDDESLALARVNSVRHTDRPRRRCRPHGASRARIRARLTTHPPGPVRRLLPASGGFAPRSEPRHVVPARQVRGRRDRRRARRRGAGPAPEAPDVAAGPPVGACRSGFARKARTSGRPWSARGGRRRTSTWEVERLVMLNSGFRTRLEVAYEARLLGGEAAHRPLRDPGGPLVPPGRPPRGRPAGVPSAGAGRDGSLNRPRGVSKALVSRSTWG